MTMREIKFNAVDEDTGVYVRYDRWRNKNYNEDNTDNEHLSSFLEFYFGYKLLQYTGLKGKNGVEIYEGDILLVDELGVGFVEYTESYFRIFRPLTFSVNLCNYTSPARLEPKNMVEVIGNIYENPELLK